MTAPPSILCPVDMSLTSASALKYAAAIAAQFATRLIVLSVEDPFLTEAADLGTGVLWSADDSKREMERFAATTLGAAPILSTLEYEVAVGKPATEILRVSRERSCDLIVMSTKGVTGARKLFFGSTTERVLRETTGAVLVTPPVDPGTVRVEDAPRLVRRIVVPVDLSPSSQHQMEIAARLSDALCVPLLLVHVIEPLKSRLAARLHLSGIEADRRARAESGLADLIATTPHLQDAEGLVAYGDPAEELAKVARDRRAGLIVMGLHGSPALGPRMGSVTYRILCLSPTLVLAVPPLPVGAEDDRAATAEVRVRS
jgi:universal stress protein E